MPWEEFAEMLALHLKINENLVEDLKYLVADKTGMVDKTIWEYFLKWFSPLYSNDVDTQVLSTKNAYFFTDVIDVVALNCFFGFMTPIETNKHLLKESSGTFLFRFSSQPGCYTLSVSNQGQVGHWRIRSEKQPEGNFFFIDDRKYDGLRHIIETHLLEPLKVNSQKSTQKPIRLERACERHAKEESIYSQF